MYLNPLKDFLKRVVFSGTRQRRISSSVRARRPGLHYRGFAPFTIAAEVCEVRAMLSGPQLIQVAPNTGAVLNLAPNANTFESQSPTQMTFTFSPGVNINPATLSATSLSVTRAGADGILGNANDVAVPIGFYGVDPSHGNQVTIRLAAIQS